MNEKTAYEKAYDRIMAELEKAYAKAEEEENAYGTVSEETDSIIVMLQMEFDMLANAA